MEELAAHRLQGRPVQRHQIGVAAGQQGDPALLGQMHPSGDGAFHRQHALPCGALRQPQDLVAPEG